MVSKRWLGCLLCPYHPMDGVRMGLESNQDSFRKALRWSSHDIPPNCKPASLISQKKTVHAESWLKNDLLWNFPLGQRIWMIGAWMKYDPLGKSHLALGYWTTFSTAVLFCEGHCPKKEALIIWNSISKRNNCVFVQARCSCWPIICLFMASEFPWQNFWINLDKACLNIYWKDQNDQPKKSRQRWFFHLLFLESSVLISRWAVSREESVI